MTRHWFRKKDGRPRMAGTLFDDAVVMLEERVMLDAVPTVSVDAPTNILLKAPTNDGLNVSLIFDNTGTDAGFGPYIELIAPKNGVDGYNAADPAFSATTTNDDGATFIGATYLGQPVNVIVNTTFNAAGTAVNTLTGDTVMGNPGDQFVVLQLPFGSYTGAQTPAEIIANFSLSGKADLGVALPISARAGFQYGLDALDNPMGPPMNDPRIVGPTAMDTFTPVLATLTKVSNAPSDREEEVGTGPNQPLTYTINVDVADGQTLTNIDITDLLPDTIHYTSSSITIGAGTITATPTNGAGELAVNPAANMLTAHFNSITGGAGPDAQITVQFYVAGTKFDGVTPVIDPNTGATTLTQNNVSMTASWQPFDSNDPLTMFTLNPAGPENTIQNQPIVIQKTSTIAVDNGPAGLNPGDVIEYTLNIQVSDYFTVGDISLNDVLSDGQRLDTSFIPVLVVNERGDVRATGSMTGVTVGAAAPGDTTTGNEFAGNFVSTFNAATGVTVSTINISQALIDAGALSFLGAPGVVSGGRVVSSDTGSTIQVRFRAIVQNNFESNALAATDQAVDQGDAVGNDVTLSGSIRDNTTGGTTLNATSAIDDATEALPIQRGSLIKTVYAVTSGGVTTLNPASVQLKAGDLITYRLEFNLPISAFQSLSFADFLPLPVLVAQDLAAVVNAPAFTAGELAYGPTDTFHNLLNAPPPTDMFDTSGNSITLSYPNYALQDQTGANQVSKIDLLFTLVVQDTNFADGLFLTNLATSSESGTINSAAGNSIVQVQLTQPKLVVQKAIVTASSGAITTPESVANITFLAPGVLNGGGQSFTLTSNLTDAGLGTTPMMAAPNLNSNVANLDAGDTARVALIVNNEGTGANGAFDVVVTDALPAGVSFLGGSLATANLVVARGDGTVLTGGGVDYTAVDNGTGLTITFVDGAQGKIGQDGAANAADIVLVTYDIALLNTVAITPTALTSNASVTNFAAIEGGIDQSFTDPTDAATIGLGVPGVMKVLTSTDNPLTTGSTLAIGESATYTVTYTFPEGTLTAVRLADILPGNFANGRYRMDSATITAVGANLTTAFAVNDMGVLSISNGGGFNDTATFGGAAGTGVVNAFDNAPATAADQIVVTYVVSAPDVLPDNRNGVSGFNTGRLTYGAADTVINDSSPISIAVPVLLVDKVLTTPTPIDASDTITFTIDVRHAGASGTDAFDLLFSDTLPVGLTNIQVTGISTNTALTTADFTTTDTNADGLPDRVTFNGANQGIFDLQRGQFFTLTVTATVSQDAQAGATYTNTAGITYSTSDNGGGGDVAGERTNIMASDGANVTIPVTLTKSVTAPIAVIGGQVEYFITATLPEGLSNNFNILDMLAPGLTFVSGNLVSVGANVLTNPGNATPTVTAVQDPADATGHLIRFDFNDLRDVIDPAAQGAADQIVVRILARVNESGNARGTVIANTGSQTTDVNGVTTTPANSNMVNVTIVDPNMTISKTVNVPTTAPGGDTVQYTAVIAATAGANFSNAEDVVFTDALGGGAVLSGTTVRIDGVDYTVNGAAIGGVSVVSSGSGFSVRFGEVATGTGHTLVYNAAISAAAGSTVGLAAIGNATVTYDAIDSGGVSTADAQGDHNQSASDDAPLGTISIAKAITATSVAGTGTAEVRAGVQDLTISETATFQLTINVPAGGRTFTIGDLLDMAGVGRLTLVGGAGGVTITPSAGVTFATAPVTTTPDLDGDGNADLNIAFSMAGGSAAGTITVTYVATAANVAANASGDQLDLPVTLTYSAVPPAGIAGTLMSSASVDIVEPVLAIDKSVVAGTPNAGDTVTYTVVVTNSGNGPAYDLTIADPLPAGLTYTGTPTLTLSLGGGTTNPGNAAAVSIPTLLVGQSATLTYQAIVGNSVVVGSAVNNSATLNADSLPGVGGRAITPLVDTATFTTEATQAFGKTIFATDNADTTSAAFRAGVPDLNIGEAATFDLRIDLSEGSTTSVVVSDFLTSGAGTLTYVPGSAVVATANGVTFTGSIVPSLVDDNADGVPDRIVFTLGTVTVPGDNAGGNNFFVIRYMAAPTDRAENQAGDAIDLTATLTTSLGTLSDAKGVDIVEPVLTIDKSVVAGTPDAGDTVTYTVVVTNTGTGPAYNVAISDPLPAGLTYTGTPTLTLSMGGGTTNPGNAAAVSIPALLVGQSATLTYQAIVGNGVVTGAAVDNTATVNSDSVPGAPAGRTSPTVSDMATFTTLATQAFAKTIFATDNADTTSAAFRAGVPDLNIGEGVTFDLRVDLSEGSTTGVVVSDFLTSGAGTLTYLPGSAVVATANGVTFTGSIVPSLVDDNADGVPDRVVFTLGTVTVPGDNAGGNNFFVIRYTAVPTDRPENQNGDAIDLTATLTSALGTLTDAKGVDIVAPLLSIDKSVVAGTPNAGDTVTYTVVVTNSGTGPAYDVAIVDPLPAGLTYTGVVTLNVGGVVTNPASAAAVTVASLLVGQSATLTYSAIVGDGVVAGSVVNNIATVDSDSVPGGPTGRAGPTLNDPATFTTEATQTFAKTISATDNPDTGSAAFRAGAPDLNIGEVATFDLRVGLSEGSTTSVVISDFLTSAAGTLTYVPGSAVVATANGVTFTGSIVPSLVDDNADGVPDRIVFTLGTVTVPGDNAGGNDFFVVRYMAVAGDRPENQLGDAIDLTATLTTSLGALSDAKGVDIVAPLLGIDKSVATVGTPNAGDTVTYTVVITNNGTGPAYNALITDPLPAGLTYVPGTATLDGVPVGGSPASVTVASLLAGQSATLTYQALIGNTAVTGVALVNTATLDGDTVPGAPTGRPTPQVSDSASIVVEALQGLDKAISSTSDANTATGAFRPGISDLHIGETADFDLTVRLTEGTTATVVLTDSLVTAAGTLTLVGTPTIVTANGITFTGTGTAGFTLVDANGDGVPEAIRFDFGTVTVPGNNDATDNFFVVRYTAVVGDRPENQAGDALDLPATLTTALGTAMASASADIVAPAIVLTKGANAGFVSRGDTVGYTISLMNNGAGPAYDLSLADVLPAGLSYVAGTTTLTVGGVTTSFASPNAVVLAMLGAGQTATVDYQVRVDPNVGAAASYTNTASVAYDSLSGPGGRTGTTSGMATITTPTNVLGLSKAIIGTTIPETGTAMFRPGVADLAIGERATIDLTASFTEGTTATVVLTDQLPLTGKFQILGTPTITFLGGITTTMPGTPVLVDSDGDGLADRITFNFGTVTVPVDGDPTNNLIRVRYDIVIPDIGANTPGAALASPALLTSAAGNASAGIFADIVAPNLTIAKAVSAGAADAGDVKTYTITLTNTGSGPAFDLTLADTLPAGLTAVANTTVLTIGGTSTNFASPASVPIAALGVGQSAVLTFNAVVGDGVVGGATLVNGATVSYDSLPGAGGHPDSAATSASFTTAAVQTLDKSIVATSEPLTGTAAVRPAITDLTIGETATIQLATTFNEGTTTNVVITDQLISASGVLTLTGTPTLVLGAGVTVTGSVTPQFVDTNGDGVPDQVRFVLGTVVVPGDNNPANNSVTIRYDAVLADTAANASGNQFTLAATLNSSIGSMTDSETADIVAPFLTITKAVPAAAADAGDVKSYTVTVANSGIGPAFDLTIADPLPAGLTAVAGSTVLTVGGVSTTFASPGAVTLASLDAGQTAVVTFQARVGDSVVGGSTLLNTATVSYDSVGGPGGHAGTASATASFNTAAVQTLDKSVVATSETFTGTQVFRPGATDLTIGERATFELATTFSEGTTANVVITDQLVTVNGVLTFTGTPTLALGSGVTVSGGVTPQFVDTNGDGVPDQVRFVLGTVVVPGDNDPANNFVRIRYDAVLANVPGNVSGGQLALPAVLTSTSGTLGDSEPVDIVAPVLLLDKALAPDQPTDGQTTAFLLTVRHGPGSTAAATNIVLTEVLPQGALLAGATIVGAPAGTTINGNVITVPLLAIGETVTIRISTSVNFTAPPSGDTINMATLSSGTVTAGVAGGRIVSTAAQAILPFGNPTTTLPGMLGLQEQTELSSMGYYLDERYIENFPEIDPVYSGSATPGTFITIDVSDETGSASGFGTGIADAGGNWLVRLPSTTVSDRLQHSRFEHHYDGSRLFRAPTANLFEDRSLLGFNRLGDRLSVGSKPSYNTQIVRINAGGGGGGFDTSFAPAWRDQFFSMEPGLSVQGVFRDRAGNAVEGLYEGLDSPEAAGLNRFNREFLTTADF